MFYKATSVNVDVSGWSTIANPQMCGMFKGATAMPASASRPKFKLTDANFKAAASQCADLEDDDKCVYGPMFSWDTSLVTDMKETFKGKGAFNKPIGVLWEQCG